jgi:hypothetical protein
MSQEIFLGTLVFWLEEYIKILMSSFAVTVAARSKAWNVFARLNTGILGSNPARGMDVCMRLFCFRCPVLVAALRRADHSSKESCQLSISVRLRNLIRGLGPTWAVAPLNNNNNNNNNVFVCSPCDQMSPELVYTGEIPICLWQS